MQWRSLFLIPETTLPRFNPLISPESEMPMPLCYLAAWVCRLLAYKQAMSSYNKQVWITWFCINMYFDKYCQFVITVGFNLE